MYTASRHRHATRWPRRIVFALAVLLLGWLMWRFYAAWQQAQPRPATTRGQLV